MATTPNWDWVFYAAAAVLGLGAIVLLWRGLLADRARGRARCPKCWYDVAALASPSASDRFREVTCPECGRVVRKARQLRRTRRRWRLVALALPLAILGAGAAWTPRVKRDGVWSMIPTWLMVQLDRKIGRDRWAALDTALTDRLWEPGLSGADLEHLVMGDAKVRWRSTWPRNEPLRLRGSFLIKRPVAVGAVGLRVATGDAVTIQCRGLPPDPSATVATPLATLTDTIWSDGSINVGVQKSAPKFTLCRKMAPNGLLICESSAIPIRLVDNLHDAITPVDSPALTAAIKQKLGLELVRLPRSRTLALTVNDIVDPAAKDVTLGFRVEVVDGDRVVLYANWWQRAGSGIAMANLPVVCDGMGSNTLGSLGYARENADRPEIRRCVVRVRGYGGIALNDLEGTKYWAGEFTMPLSELIRPSLSAPAGGQSP